MLVVLQTDFAAYRLTTTDKKEIQYAINARWINKLPSIIFYLKGSSLLDLTPHLLAPCLADLTLVSAHSAVLGALFDSGDMAAI
jgi:hypothetical protein